MLKKESSEREKEKENHVISITKIYLKAKGEKKERKEKGKKEQAKHSRTE